MRVLPILLLLWANGQSQEIPWLKLDQAKAVGLNTGKLIVVYVACDPNSGAARCSGGAGERAFADPVILKRGDDFHFVRIGDRKTAQSVGATRAPEVIFMDAEGDEFHRSGFTDAVTLDRAMTAALQKYSPRAVPWTAELPASPSGKSLLVVGFDDEKGEALKALEDRTLVKYHDRFTYVRFSLKKDAEAARKWGVSQAPALFLCDASKEAPEKNTLEKLAGKKTPATIRAAILKALSKLEPKK
jgi:hypothetical protein